MSRIRSMDTTPEMVVRRTAHRLGFRFRLHRRDLPGRPDLVFPRWRKIVFVHGCFWHQHPGCREGRVPSTNTEYWEPKLGRNVQRDAVTQETLQRAGWSTLVIWECECKSEEFVAARLARFLKDEGGRPYPTAGPLTAREHAPIWK